QIAEKLSAQRHALYSEEIDRAEHSLEVQLPFLQKVLKPFSLVPVIIGSTALSLCGEIADEIFDSIKDDVRRILVVISTDLSHYHSYEKACEMDGNFASVLEQFDEMALSALLRGGNAEACGEGPLLTGIILSKKLGANKAKILHYANSGDSAGDKRQVVGYISAAFTE
ncbi:MAG: AmmeMemoRadiSam system protein B, partial [Spirochaetota bacterium]